jgi:hypothetical protein
MSMAKVGRELEILESGVCLAIIGSWIAKYVVSIPPRVSTSFNLYIIELRCYIYIYPVIDSRCNFHTYA